MMKHQLVKFTSLATLGLLCAATPMFAQEPPGGGPFPPPGGGPFPPPGGGRGREGAPPNGPGREPMGFFQYLYPPELVMRNAEAIGLKEEQKEAIRKAMPQLSEAEREEPRTQAQKLEELLKGNHVDEAQALAQLDKLTQVENDFKRKQFETLIKIKNLLTAEQQAKLNDLKQEMWRQRGAQQPPPGAREGRPNGFGRPQPPPGR